MVTIHWQAGVSGDWTQGSDWVDGVAPGAGDDAVMDSGVVTISTSVTANSLTLTAAQATATVAGSGSLTLAGALTVSAGLFELNGGAIIDATLQGAGTIETNNGQTGSLNAVAIAGGTTFTGQDNSVTF